LSEEVKMNRTNCNEVVPMWLLCDISQGMFPGEKTVIIDAVGIRLSFFVNDSDIFFDIGMSAILVNVLSCDNDECIVHLPRETLEGWRVVRIKTGNLKSLK
jgi:hypothetical protein